MPPPVSADSKRVFAILATCAAPATPALAAAINREPGKVASLASASAIAAAVLTTALAKLSFLLR